MFSLSTSEKPLLEGLHWYGSLFASPNSQNIKYVEIVNLKIAYTN